MKKFPKRLNHPIILTVIQRLAPFTLVFFNQMVRFKPFLIDGTGLMDKKFSKGTIHKQRRLLGGGRGVAKMGIWGDFQGLTEATRGGRGVKKREN